jgi:HEPN domain-containing protein
MMQWISWADRDYLAARQLLLSRFLVQGAALANTALEKYLKAVLTFARKDVPRTHDPASLYKSLASATDLTLNPEFLATLSKSYALRYPDDLKDGYNIALNQVLLLMELDVSVFEITKRIQMQHHGKPVQLLIEQSLADNDRRVLDGNVALGQTSRKEFLSHKSQSFDFRVFNGGDTMELWYVTENLEDDAYLNREGFLPKNDKDFELAYGSVYSPEI